MFVSTKTYHQAFPVAYRQWRADSHCCQIHGYALTFHFEFESETLDVRNWVIDFGGLRPLKAQLEEWFDHTLLVAVDDPERDTLMAMHNKLAKCVEVERTGCEGIADWLYEYINGTYLPSVGEAERVWCRRVEVRETDANMAYREGSRHEQISHQ